MTHETSDHARLRDILDACFDLEELRDLCVDLDMDYDNLPGETKKGKARALVIRMVGAGRAETLARRVLELREHLTPDDVPVPELAQAAATQTEGSAAAARYEPPRHLPPLDEYFVDRKVLLTWLREQLHPGKVVTLCGSGGIGKSALARQAVGQLDPERFPDGILFHSFYQQPDPTLALEYIARTFGVDPTPTPEIAAQLALAGKRALLMLDGTEEADDLRPVLRVRGECGVLITSRKKHDALTLRQDLAPLAQNNAIELLCAWAAGEQGVDAPEGHPTEHPDTAFDQICTLLDGLPLAIRLVGKYLNETGEPASEYLDWLKLQPFAALGGQGTHRDESVDVLLSRSVAQVSEDAQQVLAVVGQLAFAPFGVEPIAAALNCDLRHCQTASDELVRCGLLLRNTEIPTSKFQLRNRYEVTHALIHAYARRRMRVEPEAGERLAAYYENFAREHCQQGVEGYTRLDAERVHLLKALEGCHEREAWQAVSNLSGAIDTYLDRQGYWTERQAALKMNLIAAQQQANQQDEAWCLNNLGLTCLHQGDYATALPYLEQSLAIRREIGDKAGEGTTLNNLSQIYDARGDYATALTYLEQSLAIQREIGDKAGEGITCWNIGQMYLQQGDLEQAEQYICRTVQIDQEIGHPDLEQDRDILEQIRAAQGQGITQVHHANTGRHRG